MTVWFAQNGSQNIDAAYSGHPTLWNDVANGSGNWLTWASLASGDYLVANGKTLIAIDVDVNVGATGRLTTAGNGGVIFVG